jgi:hypothetical protein
MKIRISAQPPKRAQQLDLGAIDASCNEVTDPHALTFVSTQPKEVRRRIDARAECDR